MAMEFAPPSAFGIPEKFADWRPSQPEAIVNVLDSPQRFVGVAAPTGFGKSIAYMGMAAVSGVRTLILTSTKGLQTQLTNDFAAMGLADMRGMIAYKCKAAHDFGLPEYTTVADGPCHSGTPCEWRTGGCGYYDAYGAARRANLVVTNYAFWFHSLRAEGAGGTEGGKGLGTFQMLVCDEAHDAPDELASFLGTEIEDAPVEGLLGTQLLEVGADQQQWKEWGRYHLAKGNERLDWLQQEIKQQGNRPPRSLITEAAELKRLLRKVEIVATMQGEWVWERMEGERTRRIKFDPIWPMQYAERYLWRNIPKVVMVSATVRPKTFSLLGVDWKEMEFDEYPSQFAVARRPVVWVPTVQLNHRNDETHTRLWLNRVDQIVGQRADRKGIIHAVSYKRMRLILENSRYKGIMLGHSSTDTQQTIARFKAHQGPLILVSPSVTTGYDFPYQECEYQIIVKVPFPDLRAAVLKARTKIDKDYGNYIAMQQLVQATGRGMRAVDDSCETLILDDNVRWFIKQAGKFAPQWWLDSYTEARTIPKPLAKL